MTARGQARVVGAMHRWTQSEAGDVQDKKKHKVSCRTAWTGGNIP